MNTQNQKGCGCGSTGSSLQSTGNRTGGCSCGGACTCRGGTCPTCQSGAFERPQFFAGQLLTEDDLQELVNYVVTKGRLHNRALFGDGVVCGLQVTCDPCDGANLTVQPGYALDCCGNDIVVECAAALDINRMIRDFRAKQLGHDCGDPCKDSTNGTTSQSATGSVSASATEGTPVRKWLYQRHIGNRDDASVEIERKHVQEYCLYVRYCEQPTELVAPYATDDCSTSGCQATRVREGYCFELRCKTEHVQLPTVIDVFSDCLGNLKDLRSIAGKAALIHRTFNAIAVAGKHALSKKRIEFTKEDGEALLLAKEELQNATLVEATESALVVCVQLLIEVTALLKRQELATSKYAEHDAATLLSAVTGPIENARKYLEEGSRHLTDSFALVLITEVIEFLRDQAKQESDKSSFQMHVLANGGFVTPRLLQSANSPSRELRNILMDRLTRAGLTNCQLRDRLAALPASSYDSDAIHPELATLYSRDVSELVQLVFEYEQECFCDALNPPCSDCQDPAVLLACFQWKECKVLDICNLERKWVLTGPNLRYWIPWSGKLGEFWEQLCCGQSCNSRQRIERAEIVERMLARNVKPDLADIVRLLARIPAQPATFLAPVAHVAPPTTVADWQRRFEETQIRLEQVQNQYTEVLTRLEQIEASGTVRVKEKESRRSEKK